jgi:hypothetical protein
MKQDEGDIGAKIDHNHKIKLSCPGIVGKSDIVSCSWNKKRRCEVQDSQ